MERIYRCWTIRLRRNFGRRSRRIPRQRRRVSTTKAKEIPRKRHHADEDFLPLSVNFHFTQRCNYKCKFCFLNRPTTPVLPIEKMKRGLEALRDAGVQKLNFAGGEPFMHPKLLGEMVEFCKMDLEFPCVQITTNARLVRRDWMDLYGKRCVDIMTVSVDSFDEGANVRIGRGRGEHVKHVYRVAKLCRDADVRVKINTVVCSENVEENMSDHIRRLDPFRWKVVQMYLVEGMNSNTGDPDRDVPHMSVSRRQFDDFLRRHREVDRVMIAEPNERFIGAYLLLNERMRFLSTGEGGVESDCILDVGVRRAIEQCDFTSRQFEQRDGAYFLNGSCEEGDSEALLGSDGG